MNILVTGGTGFVGSKLVQKLKDKGYNVIVLTRKTIFSDIRLIWDDCYQIQNPEVLPEKLDMVINLMGENLSSARWTKKQKQELRDSRIISARELKKQLKELNKLPERWIQTSAIGIYPKNQEEIYDEDSIDTGDDFLALLCKEWEKVPPNETKNQIIRIGLVLEKNGGLLNKLHPIFRYNLGANLSNGQQYMSWIHLDDLVQTFLYLIENPDIKLINAVSEVSTNAEFTDAFTKALSKFKAPSIPGFVLKLLLGEMSSLALDSQEIRSKYNLQYKYKNIYDLLKDEYHK